MSARTGWLITVMLLTGGMLAACRNAPAAAPPPTLTPTPMSTPLATLPPTLAPGSSENPVRFLIVTDAAGRAANTAVTALTDALQSETDLTVDVTLVSSDRDAVEALCNAFDGPPALALLSAPGYSAASARNCGLPLFHLSDGAGSTSRELIFIASDESGISSLAELAGSTFCRLSADDLTTWQVPALWMLAQGLPPTSTLTTVTDVAGLDALVEQVASGDCDAAALALDDYERSVTPELEADITRLSSTLNVPLGVVVAARELPLGIREALAEALSAFGRTAAGADALEALAGAAGVVSFTDGALADWDELIARTGIDFASFQG